MTAPTRFLEDMQAALDALERRARGAELGAIGFCFGGGQMWQLLAADARLAAVAPFYGRAVAHGPTLRCWRSMASSTPVSTLRPIQPRLRSPRRGSHEIVTEPGANHAFFNDTGGNYNATAAADAWTRLIAFFRQNSG